MPEFENTANNNGRREPLVQLGNSRAKSKQESDRKNQKKITISIKSTEEVPESVSQPIETSFVPGVLGEEAKETKVKLSFSNRAKNDAGISQIHTRWHAKSSGEERTNSSRFSVGEINLNENGEIPKDDFKDPAKKTNLIDESKDSLYEKGSEPIGQRENASKSSSRVEDRQSSSYRRAHQEDSLKSTLEDKRELKNSRSRGDRFEKKSSRKENIEQDKRQPSQIRSLNEPNRKRSDYKRRQNRTCKSSHSSLPPKGFFAKIKYFFEVLFGTAKPPKVKRRVRRREDKPLKSSENRSRKNLSSHLTEIEENKGSRKRTRNRRNFAQTSPTDPSSRGRNRNYNRRRGKTSSTPRNSSQSGS